MSSLKPEFDMDEDITQEILEQINAALIVNPKFDFNKLMELSNDVNSEVNKKHFSQVISVTFLRHLGMSDAAALILEGNLPLENALKSLHLENEEAQKWFIRFLAVMNPALISSVSATIMAIVNGVMLKNTRSSDSDRMRKLNHKMNRLVSSGELEKKVVELSDDKPQPERVMHKSNANLGLIGWFSASSPSRERRKSRSSSSSTSSSKSKDIEPSVSKGKSRNDQKERRTSRKMASNKAAESSSSRKTISDLLSNVSMTDDEIDPTDSISEVIAASKEDVPSVKVDVTRAGRRKNVRIREEDSIVSD